MLIHSTSPIIGALLAWGYLSETLTPLEIVGIGITISGVAWGVLERAATDSEGNVEG